VAPETLLKEYKGIVSDFWALGVLLYEMVYGLPPFYNPDTDI